MPTTTNHGFNIPTVGADADEWGTELNDAFQDFDDLTSGAQNTVLGRVAASAGPYTQLTATQLTTIPNAVVGDAGAGGTKGMVPAPAAGDGAARKVLMADGTWGANEIKAWAIITGATGAVVAGRNIACNRTGVGLYDITFSTALASANYAVFTHFQNGSPDIFGSLAAGRTTAGFSYGVETAGGAATDPTQLFIHVIAA
jgi:hypothetical protein